MYLAHWGLSRSPFGGAIYPSLAHEEALARIDYLVQHRRLAGALTGDRGCGKSSTLRAALDEQRRQGASVALVDAAGLTVRELWWRIATQLGATPDLADDVARLWRRIEALPAHSAWRGRPIVVGVDDAGQMPHDVGVQLVRWLDQGAAAGGALTSIFALPTAQLPRLGDELLDRIELRIDLFAWNVDDTTGFVQHALIEAGRCEPLFTDDALAMLTQLAEGAPRRIARLADFALVTGAAQNAEEVEAWLIEAAFDELAWAPTSV